MADRKPKLPVTPLPLKPDVRASLYKEAEMCGRKLTKHIQMILEDHTEEFEKHQ